MSFHIGQQVVCINDEFSPDPHWRRTVRTFPFLHGIYTIREIHVEPPLVGFCFYEFGNPRSWFGIGYAEPAFNCRNFRPVKKTNIEAFEKLLAPVDGTPRKLVDA